MSQMERPEKNLVGKHLIADLSGINPDILREGEYLMRVLESALQKSGFQILKTMGHQFSEKGNGFTGVVLLAESHATIHTYPEKGYLAFDVFACGSADPRKVLKDLVEALSPQEIQETLLDRTQAPMMERT